MVMRVVVIEESEATRLGLAEIFNRHPELNLVGSYSCLQEMLSYLEQVEPEVVLLNESVGGKALIAALQQIARQHPTIRPIVSATTWNHDKIEEYAALGVLGFLCRTDKLMSILPAAIGQVAQGELYMSPLTIKVLLPSSNTRSPLNARHMQVLMVKVKRRHMMLK